MNNDQTKRVQADDTLVSILEAIQDTRGATASEIADIVGVSKSTAYRHLTTLHDHRLVTKQNGTYDLSLRFLDLGGYAREQNTVFGDIKPTLKNIAEETGEFVGFLVEEDGLGVYLHGEMGNKGVQNDVRIGRHVHLHQSAAGKAILGSLPEQRVEEIIDEHGLPAKTPETITDRDHLKEELATIRNRRYAYARDEHTDGLWAVGVPVHDRTDQVAGAILVAGPTHRMHGEWFEQGLPEYLKGTVKEFELNHSFS
ncbi:IclR family transcriptional regulator [Halobacterium noricense]|uniref:IclR family transcriptional regulator n=1 Tax=Halobacterium noricense TaxID=223182 RepID=UPI001E354FFE|nr:IclR family transcriptional regulator [Halobacterium noricense]UHH24008.1 IclR family transcriptional regulator [Halobacterium noricense]